MFYVFVFYLFVFCVFVYLCICVLCICVHPSTLSPLTTYSICEAHWPGPWDSDNTQSVLRNPQIYKYIQNLSEKGNSWRFGWHLEGISVNICPKYLPSWTLWYSSRKNTFVLTNDFRNFKMDLSLVLSIFETDPDPSEMYFLKCFCKFILRGKYVKAGRWFPLGKIKLGINLNSLEAISVSNGY